MTSEPNELTRLRRLESDCENFRRWCYVSVGTDNFECLKTLMENGMKDKARIDALEKEMKADPIMLHDCTDRSEWPDHPRGLSLLGGERTLRVALDILVGAATTELPGKRSLN